MIRISCSVKTHAFHLAEQLERKHVLSKLYTIYQSAKDPITSQFNHRKDTEQIALNHLHTFPYLAPLKRLIKDPFTNNSFYDTLVSRALKRDTNYRAFIGWSGMSLMSMTQARRDKKVVIVERGSSHIEFQAALLEDEYATWGFEFKNHDKIIKQELKEYDLADYVVVPSSFVERTFLDRGFDKEKLFKNNFGSNALFSPTQPKRARFTILYVGNLSIRKGLPYLFQALSVLPIDPALFDVWFVGSISAEINQIIPKYRKANWKFFGHVNQQGLADIISACSVAVHPSLEEGLSMVIPQLMACGTPVIATANTGGEDIIQQGESGYIIPIRSPDAIVEKLMYLFQNPDRLHTMREASLTYSRCAGTWDQYGDRYYQFLNSHIS